MCTGISSRMLEPDSVGTKSTFCGSTKAKTRSRILTLQKLTRGSEIDNLRAEIRKSHALLFHRHTASRKLAEKFYSLKLKRMRYLEWSELTGRDAGKWTGTPALMVRCHAREIDADNAPTAKILKEFPLLAPRMVHLL